VYRRLEGNWMTCAAEAHPSRPTADKNLRRRLEKIILSDTVLFLEVLLIFAQLVS
jgi:hypothetical protein